MQPPLPSQPAQALQSRRRQAQPEVSRSHRMWRLLSLPSAQALPSVWHRIPASPEERVVFSSTAGPGAPAPPFPPEPCAASPLLWRPLCSPPPPTPATALGHPRLLRRARPRPRPRRSRERAARCCPWTSPGARWRRPAPEQRVASSLPPPRPRPAHQLRPSPAGAEPAPLRASPRLLPPPRPPEPRADRRRRGPPERWQRSPRTCASSRADRRRQRSPPRSAQPPRRQIQRG
mmetsp:Transcript_12454/g.44007  ORF Transcript_12454/g.44007 Transcript_12454/m.44007 type:complete len:233 (-) Transcript_12454:4645-5343(-)